jgi:prophage regulatory protein
MKQSASRSTTHRLGRPASVRPRPLNPEALYRLIDIVGAFESDQTRVGGYIPASPATIWRWVRAGRFPKPVKLGPGVTAWRGADLIAFIQNSSGSAK